MSKRRKAQHLLHLAALLSLLVSPALFAADDVALPGGGTVVLGPDDALELILKPAAGGARGTLPSVQAWLLDAAQANPAQENAESGRALVFPSPTRSNEFIVHLRGLNAPKKDDAAHGFDVLLRWSFPGTNEHGESRLKNAVAIRTQLPDVVLLLDGSGSMVGSDPDSSRVEAARKFISIGKTSGGIGNIALIQFATTVHELLPLTPVNEDEKFQRALKGITADGYTDIDGSIRKALETLRGPSGKSTGAIVLLTDGVQEPGVYGNAHTLARAAGIPIHTVALGPDADRDLLQRIASDTGGTFSAAARGQELIRLYSAIAAGIVGGRTILSAPLPVGATRALNFPTDGSCRTLVASIASEASGTLTLTAPKGERESTDAAYHPVYYKVGPPPGNWSAQWSVASGEARLEASAHTPLFPLFFRATVETDSGVEIDPDDPRVGLSLTDASTLVGTANVELALEFSDRSERLSATLTDDGAHEDGASGDGIYAGLVPKLGALELPIGTTGTLTATVTGTRANGEAFRREARTHWTLVRGSARGLVVPRELDFGTRYAGSTADAKLPLRVRGAGGTLRSRSLSPATGVLDLAGQLSLAAVPATLPNRESTAVPFKLSIPDALRPGDYGGVVEFVLSGDGQLPEVSARVPWHVRVQPAALALSPFAVLDLGSVAPGAQLRRSIPLATRGGRTTVTTIELQDCAEWTSALRLPMQLPLRRPTSENLKFAPIPQESVQLDERGAAVDVAFAVAPDCISGTIFREVIFRSAGRELGRMLVRVDVLPQWIEGNGAFNFGRVEPGDTSSATAHYAISGAFTERPALSAVPTSNHPAAAVSASPSQPGDVKLDLKLGDTVADGPLRGVVELHGGAADAAVFWTADVVRPKLKLSAETLDFGSLYPGQSRKLSLRASFKGVRPTNLVAGLEAPPTKPLVSRIRLNDDALTVSAGTQLLEPGSAAEIVLDLKIPDAAQDGIYKTRAIVETRLGRVFVPVAFQVVSPIPLPPFHVSPIDIVLYVVDGQPGKPVAVTIVSQSDEPLSIRAHAAPMAGLARISAELLRDGASGPEFTFVLPGRGESKILVRPIPDTEDGDQSMIVVESGVERQTVHATVVHSHRITSTPHARTEGFDWWTLLIIIPLLICAFYVKQMVKRRWVRVAAYSALLHFGIFFFIVIPQSHKDDTFGDGGEVPGVDIDLSKLDDTPADDAAAPGNDAPGAIGPRGGDGLAALANANPENSGGALATMKDGGQAPGGPAAAAALQQAGAGDAPPALAGPAFERGPSSGGPDEALAALDDPGGATPAKPELKVEAAGAPAAAHVPLNTAKVELPAGRSGPVARQAVPAAAAKADAGGGEPSEKIVLLGTPGAARGDGEPLAIDDAPLLVDATGAPARENPKAAAPGGAAASLGEPGARTEISALAATSTPGATQFAPNEKLTAPATRHVSGTSGAVVPESGKAWGEGGVEKGSAAAGTESDRKTGLIAGRGDDEALDAGPVLGDGIAGTPVVGKSTGAGKGGAGSGSALNGERGATGSGSGGEGTLPRGGLGVSSAIGNGRGLGKGDGLSGAISGAGNGIGRGAGPGQHGNGGPGGLGSGFSGSGGDSIARSGPAIGSGRASGGGGGGIGTGSGFGDAPLDLGGGGSGGTGTARAGNGSGQGGGSGAGTGIANGNGDGGPGAPHGIPGGVSTLGGHGSGGDALGIASAGGGRGLGIGSQTSGGVSGLGDGLPGSNGESATARTVGNHRGAGTGAGSGLGDAPLDAEPLGSGSGAGNVAQGKGNGNGSGVGHGRGNGIGDDGPPGPRGNGLGAGGLINGQGTGGGGKLLAGYGNGTGELGTRGPAAAGLPGNGAGGNGSGLGGKSFGGKASVQAALDGLTLDRAGKNTNSPNAHEGAHRDDRPHWGPPGGNSLRVNVGLAQHAADWNSSPTALFNLATAFRERCGLPDAEAEVRTVKLDDPKSMASCRFLLLTANYAIPFTDAEIAGMRTYVENGGTLWFNDSGASGDERFDVAARKDFERLFPGSKIEVLEMTHPLFHAAYDLTHGYKGYRIPPGDKYRQEFMEGITLAGRDGKPRTAVIYTRNDYADGLEIDPRNIAGRPSLTDLTADEMLEGSLRFGINLLAYSLGSDAPQMPPPPESTAQFEKIYRYNGPPLPVVENFGLVTGPDGLPVWSVQDWGNPAAAEIAATPGGGHALKIAFRSGDKMKAAAGRNIEMNLGGAHAIVLDIYSSLPHGFNVALLFSTKPDWLGYESRPIFVRPGWNRNVRFPLNLDDFKTAKNEWKTYDQPFAPRENVGRLDFLLYNLNENGEVKMESLRIEPGN